MDTALLPNTADRIRRVEAAIIESLALGISYDDDMKRYVAPRVMPYDEAVNHFIGEFAELADWAEQRTFVRNLVAQIVASPRGTWAIIKASAKNETNRTYYKALMSDGSDKPAIGGSSDHYDAPPPYEHVYARMAEFEWWHVRKAIREQRAAQADRDAIAQYNIQPGRTYKNVDLGLNGKVNRCEVTAVEDCMVLFTVIKRGSANRYKAKHNAVEFVRRARLGTVTG